MSAETSRFDTAASDEGGADTQARREWMGLLARADATQLADLFGKLDEQPEFECVRGPEVGLVMVRGRAGAQGRAFNVGEMTVTRCTVRLSDGRAGHAYVGGRDHEKAKQAAVFDALLQSVEDGSRLRDLVLEPLSKAEDARRSQTNAKTAATKVDFFTMVRSE